MKSINGIIEDVISAEGGYVNDPRDAGGETKYGITVAVARADGYTGPMRDLPRERAFDIYKRKYVIAPGFDKVAAINSDIGAELADTGVNMGQAVAGRFLQRALNAINNAGLVVDGQIGPASIKALKAYVDKRGATGVKTLLKALNSLQATRYIELAEGRAANRAFIYGWLTNRVEI